ncbi:MAG: sulfurtransferase [Myxococcales bacterium]|nr:sulfurtransferase [Myxococcales bacterium]
MPVRVVDVRGATSLVSRGAAVLDARDAASFAQGHMPGAQLYAWQAFTGEGALRGRVKPDLQAIAQALSSLGVDSGRPTLVYGAAGLGWGEEGHAAWLLALLGHPDIALLDGGFAAWRNAGRPVVSSSARARPGSFVAQPRPEFRADVALAARAKQILDVRSASEYNGATPYGELRGGHLPGARHLDWRSLLDTSGRLIPSSKLLRALADAGFDPDAETVVYCTCGVRSAMAAVSLAARGVARVRNFDGSMAEWAGDPNLPVVR